MKNVQIIDSAGNCTYSIFQFSDAAFAQIFPNKGQDIEFIEDVIERLGDARTGKLLTPAWKRPVDKKKVRGIHGTLFYELAWKKEFYPTKIDSEMITKLL